MYLLILLFVSIPIFFHNLSSSSLNNWDEAWYGEIAKQINLTGEYLVMSFGGKVFTDHPPAGFWLISITQKIFGINELGTRAAGALFGIICLWGIYMLGKKLFGRTPAFCAALAMLSAPWFVIRARSGNLDVFLVAFFVWSIYFAFKAIEDKAYLSHLSISLAMLFLTKTMVPFTILPALAVIFFGNKSIKPKDTLRPISFLLIATAPWFFANYAAKPDFLQRYFKIGLPGVKAENNIIGNIMYVKEYIHNGIGKWFWPGVLATIGSVFILRKKYLALSVAVLSLASPFVFSEKGHIWHMIPVYPFLLLLLFGFGVEVAKKILRLKIVANAAILVFTLVLFIPQARANWYNFIDIPSYISDEAILSTRAKDFDEPLYIDGDFIPVATFYSNKIVNNAHGNLQEFFNKNDDFLLITKEDRLMAEVENTQYEIIAKDRDKVLAKDL